MFGAPKVQPPPPLPEPASPPTYASASVGMPRSNIGRFGALTSSILSGPLGAQDSRMTQRKSLLGQ